MPLGNHTSQFFANVYLDKLDKFVKHELKVKYYIRYVDDFVILHDSKQQLEKWKKQINNFLKTKLSIELHPDKSRVISLFRGVNFLGFRIFSNHMLIRKNNLHNFERKFKEYRLLYREGQITREKVVEILEGWLAYTKHASTFKYRRGLLKNFNKNFPIKTKKQFTYTKKYRNFYKKVYYSKLKFSVQKTLFLLKKHVPLERIAIERNIKEGTVWAHIEHLIEYGQISIWKIMPKNKIVGVLCKIKSGSETLKEIKSKLSDKTITYNEIACVKAYFKMKQRIKRFYNNPQVKMVKPSSRRVSA
jgi:hypothetical protein